MATTDLDTRGLLAAPALGPPSDPALSARRMHRIRTVRLGKGMQIKTLAQQMDTDASQLKLQEQERTDLWVSELLKWREALDVPLSELVVDEDAPIHQPPLDRPRLVNLIETAVAIHAQSPVVAIRRMARMLVEQLVEIIPDLAPLSPWHGKRGYELLEEEEDAFVEDDES